MSENGQRYCLYTVAQGSEDPNCPLEEGEPYAMECDCWCNDIYVMDEPCAGALLVALDPECRYYE